MLSIGTFGGPKGRHGSDTQWTTAAGADELDKLQEELRQWGGGDRSRGQRRRRQQAPQVSELHEWQRGGGVAKLKQRSIRKIMAGAPGAGRRCLKRVSVRLYGHLLHKNTHPEKTAFSEPVMKGDLTVQTPQREQQEGSKWIRTDFTSI
uniref:Uncharacterized protein n=1 Tax=Oryza punctata TaxID=4537 RepID=A0A0E0LCR2_ORYPU